MRKREVSKTGGDIRKGGKERGKGKGVRKRADLIGEGSRDIKIQN